MHTLRSLFLSLCISLLSFYSLAADETHSMPSVNINTADVEVLSGTLKGVGPAKARAIIAYRENYGAFKSVDELEEVKGIGESLININRSRIVLE